MKKLIALTFAMLFLGAGIASATDFSLSGSYYVRGSYFDNTGGTGIDVDGYGNYDHELSVDSVWQIDDTTKVFARFEMRDETWGKGNLNWWAGEGATDTANDDNIYVEQVWGAHTFGNGGTLTVGLMSAGAWGTAFFDKGDEAYRIKWVQPTSVGVVIGILEKGDAGERGNAITGDDTDDDTYILAMVSKLGDINVKPLILYSDNYSTALADDVEVYLGMLAFDGAFGAVGFEAELDYLKVDMPDGMEDPSTWGAYLNLWMTADALKFGIVGAYGSYDDDAATGFDFGDDFEAGGAMIMGDDIIFGNGSANSSNQDLTAGQLIALYADYAVSDKLSIGAYLGYAECGYDDNSEWDGATVWELSVDATYAITANLTYKVAAGTAELEYGDDTPDPDKAYELYHKLSFAF